MPGFKIIVCKHVIENKIAETDKGEQDKEGHNHAEGWLKKSTQLSFIFVKSKIGCNSNWKGTQYDEKLEEIMHGQFKILKWPVEKKIIGRKSQYQADPG